MSKGLLIVVSGPSGCGKGTILKEVLAQDSNLFYSVSATTRQPREGEVHGESYYFLQKSEFEALIANGGMLEHACYCENYYGTPKAAVEAKLQQGNDVILEIEVQGAMQIQRSCPEAVFLFILPPSIEELSRRLHKRGTETEDKIARRIAAATEEIASANQYDYVIVNAALDKAIEDFRAILRAEKLSAKNNKDVIDEVLGV